jgi:hypothetical protein
MQTSVNILLAAGALLGTMKNALHEAGRQRPARTRAGRRPERRPRSIDQETVGAYIFQRRAAETERPIWSVPKLVTCALPALPKW